MSTKVDPSAAARALRAIKSDARTQASRANGQAGGRPRGTGKPLTEIPCNCSAASDATHKATCPRGRAYRRHLKAAQQSTVESKPANKFLLRVQTMRATMAQSGVSFDGTSGAELVNAGRDERQARIMGTNGA